MPRTHIYVHDYRVCLPSDYSVDPWEPRGARSLSSPCFQQLPRRNRVVLLWRRVQLNLFVCCPFGNYEIDLDVDSYSDEGSTLQQRTAWEIENGYDEVLTQTAETPETLANQWR